jgi:hypothetical protein
MNNYTKTECYIMALVNFIGLSFLCSFFYNAIITKKTVGKLGAIYSYPNPTYLIHVGFMLLGIVMSLYLMKLIFSWIKK